MIAIGLTFALLVFWLIVGLAALDLLHTRRNMLQNVLLAPAVGIAVTTLPVVWLNRAGLPVASFSTPLAIVLFVVSVSWLWWNRPLGSLRSFLPVLRLYLPFVGVLILAFVLTGRPLAEFGFDWTSYANADMANDVGDAHRYAAHGTFDPPDIEQVVAGTDYTHLYWIFKFGGYRLGSAPTLAWLIGLTGMMGYQIVMPAIIAAHLALISATCGLVCQGRRSRLAAFLTGVLVSGSALLSLGALLQLSPQTIGLGLLAVAVALLLRQFDRSRPSALARHGALVGIVGAALLMIYPEALPFLGLGFVLYTAVSFIRRRLTSAQRPLLLALGSAGLISLASTNNYLSTAINYFIVQVLKVNGESRAGAFSELFPYYRIPSGFANLWGLQRIALISEEPWLSLGILAGMLLLLMAAGAAVALTWRLQPVAAITLSMLIAGAQLVSQQSGFGLYKLAMFIQPFMLGTLVVAWISLTRRKVTQIVPLLMLGALGAHTQLQYVDASRGIGASLNEVHEGSSTHIYSEFGSLIKVLHQEPDARLLVDASSFVIEKFQSIYAQGISTQFASKNPYSGFEITTPSRFADSQSLVTMASLRSAIEEKTVTGHFPWFEDSETAAYAYLAERGDPRDFSIDMLGQPSTSGVDCTYIATLTKQQSVLNRRTPKDTDWVNFALTPCRDVRNHLIFIDSSLGHTYYGTSDARVISLYQLEDDPFAPGATFAAVGRRLLFQALNPSAGMRVVLHLTATLNGDGENRLPPAVVIGSERRALPLFGRGSARIFSDPIVPIIIADRAFVGVDMGIDGRTFPEHRPGLMGLFGTDVLLDRRLLTAFARDISAVASDELDRLSPPSVVRSFPTDLADPDLEYSGVYEDGWISEAAYFGLSQPSEYSTVVARGIVPQTDRPDFRTELHLVVDSQEVARRVLGPGSFELRGSAPPGDGRRRVELRFSEFQQLPAPDRRPAAALMELVGFESESEAEPPAAVKAFPADVENPGARASGLATDGWLDDVAAIDLTQPAAPAALMVQGLVPLIGDPGFTTELRVLVDGQEVGHQTLGLGDFELRAPVTSGAGRRRVELRFSATQQLPAPDSRQVGARVSFVGFEAGDSSRTDPR